MKIKFTDHDLEVHEILRAGNRKNGEHAFISATSCNEICLDDSNSMCCIYRNGTSFYHNGTNFYHTDYDSPSNIMQLTDQSHPALFLIDKELCEDSFENIDEYTQKIFDEIKKLCPLLDTEEKIFQVYMALRDNVPSLNYSADIDDYEEGYDGEVELNRILTPKQK